MQIQLLQATKIFALIGCFLSGHLVLNGQDFALSRIDKISSLVIQSNERSLAKVIKELSEKHEVFLLTRWRS